MAALPKGYAYTPNPGAVRIGGALLIKSARGELTDTKAWRLQRADEAVHGLVNAIRATRPWLQGVLDHLEPQDDTDDRRGDVDLWLAKALRDAVTLRELIAKAVRS